MCKVVLVSCAKTKLTKKSKAKDLYVSDLFKKSMAYAEKLYPDKIYILSAQHHLLKLEKEIEPYNLTLKSMKAKERREWSKEVLKQLKQEVKKNWEDEETEIVFLAGKEYREYLIESIKSMPKLEYSVPMEGLLFGEQLHYLKERLT